MKKIKSSIIVTIFAITITLISMFGLSNKETQAYNHNPTNILNNVFKQGQTTILPFIFDNANESITKTYLISEFEKANIQIKNIPTLPKTISTGTLIETEDTDYTVVIYGDVDGNGKVTVYDAQSVFDHWATSTDFIGIAFKLAANVYNNDSKITVYDAQAIFDFWMENTTKLVLNEPANVDVDDTEAPVITLNGANPQYIEKGTSYVELGAIVTDNVNENLAARIDTTNVNVNKDGTYVVKYNATDLSGNDAIEVERTVIVRSKTKIEVDKGTAKVNYTYNEDIDLTGVTVKLIWSDGSEEDITSKVTLATPKATSDTVLLTYEDFTCSYSITINNYVTGIKIIKSPTRKSYVDGDTISLEGIVVNEVYVDGTTKVVENDTLLSDLRTAQYGRNTITVRYVTANTVDGQAKVFEDTFNITIGKGLTTVNISSVSSNITGFCYDYIPAVALKSGIDEVAISAEDIFVYKIYKDNVEVPESEATIVPGGNVSSIDAQTILSLKAKTAGTYKIVLVSVNGITNTVGETEGVTVNVEEDNTINIITLTDRNDETKKYEVRIENSQAITNTTSIKLAVDKISRFNITFGHAYLEDGEVVRITEIPVVYSKISNSSSYIKFVNAAGEVIAQDTDGAIARLTVEPTTNEIGNTTLPITVDGVTYSFNVEVLEYEKHIIIPNTITFKTTEVPGESKQIGDEIYTLLPIKLEDSVGDSIAMPKKSEIQANITITYKGESCEDSWYVFVKYFYNDTEEGILETTGDGIVEYLGFAKDPDITIDAPIVITYKTDTPIEITVVP